MEIKEGKIIDVRQDGATIFVPIENWNRFVLRQYDAVQVGFPDGRTITPSQRKKAYACIRDIAEWIGDTVDNVKPLMKLEFVQTRLEALQKEIFSLSSCDVTTAKEFITYLIDFMIDHEVPSRIPLYELSEDLERFTYTCLMKKTCCVCGETNADMHHVQSLGMGRDRDEAYQIGMEVISLCRKCHTIAHTKGNSWITKDLILKPIPLTSEIGKIYGYSKKSLGAGIDN